MHVFLFLHVIFLYQSVHYSHVCHVFFPMWFFFSMINLYSQGIMHGSQDVACIFFVKFRVYHVQMHLHMFFHASTYYSYYSQIFMLRVHNQSCVNARSVFGHISSWLLCKILLWHACTLAHPPVITSQSVWINLQMALGDDSILFINFFFSPSWGNCFWRLCHSPARCVSDSCRGRWVLICTNRRAWNKVLIMKCGGLEACGA